MKQIPVAIVDDDALIVELVKTYLDQQSEVDVVMTAKSGEEFLSL